MLPSLYFDATLMLPRYSIFLYRTHVIICTMKDNAIHRAMRVTLQEILLSFCSFRYIIFYYIYGKMNEINISLFCNFVSYIYYNFIFGIISARRRRKKCLVCLTMLQYVGVMSMPKISQPSLLWKDLYRIRQQTGTMILRNMVLL